jgi:hypothetical protein
MPERERPAVAVAVVDRADRVHRAEHARRDLDLIAVLRDRDETVDGIVRPTRSARHRSAARVVENRT